MKPKERAWEAWKGIGGSERFLGWARCDGVSDDDFKNDMDRVVVDLITDLIRDAEDRAVGQFARQSPTVSQDE